MVQSTLLAQLDLASAVDDELLSTTRLLPLRSDQQALAERANEVETHIRAALQQNSVAKPASVVFASKQKGSRPLNIWRLQDRVLYRALTQRLASSLPEQFRSRISHSEFARMPLDNADNHFINTTDINSFYVYVDHDVLADELIAQTGDYAAVTALTELLGQVMGGRVGIPQVHDASDILGDTYIDPIRRRLIRAGYDTYTYSDDFRIGAKTLGQARAALELCASAARELGLVLNEPKTYTYGRQRYEETLDTRSEAEKRILHEEDLDDAAQFLFGIGTPYADDTVVTPLNLHDLDAFDAGFDNDSSDDAGEVDAQRAAFVRRVWVIWNNPDSDNHRAPVVRQLLARALPDLGAVRDFEPLDKLDELLRTAPDLTPNAAGYLENLAKRGGHSRHTIRTRISEVAVEDTLSEWQKIWIAHVAGRLHRTEVAPTYVKWLEDCVSTGHGLLAAYAAEALGRIRHGDPGLFAEALNRVGEEHKPPIIWALGRLDPERARSVADGALDRLLVPENA